MKTTILLIISLVFFTSCEAEAINGNNYTNSTSTGKQVEYIHNDDINNDFIGVYTHHLGEETTGTIVITKTRLLINTSQVYYDIDLTKIKNKRLWCKNTIYTIKFNNEEGEEIIIQIYLFKHPNQPHITIAINHNILGTFDPIKEPIEPVIEN